MKTPLLSIPPFFYRLPISQKILFITAATTFLTLAALCSISVYLESEAYRKRAVNELTSLSLILSSNTVASLRFDDRIRAQEYVDSLQHEEEIEQVAIYDAEGELFASYRRSGADQPLPNEPPDFRGALWQRDGLSYAKDIILEGKPVGSLLIEKSADNYQAFLQRSILTAIGLMLGGLAMALLLAARLQRLIVLPIKELADATHRIAAEEDYRTRAPKRYEDEIGSLVDSFNAMLEAIAERDASLREANATLERKVAERTDDLRKRAASLKVAMEAANAASVAKSEFLATTSHELRTPLNPIIGYVEMLLAEDPAPETARRLRLVKQSAEQLLRLIDDILDFSRIERGVLQIESKATDYRQVCAQARNLMAPAAEAKKLELTYQDFTDETLSQAGRKVMLDGGKLQQVLLNLVGNAIKFTRQGSIAIRSRLEQPSSGKPLLHIEVEDTGIGIDAGDFDKLFKPFSQIDGSYTRQYGGMGLGLAISRKVVEAMDGEISCRSEPGRGSRFSLQLPVQLADAVDVPTDAPEPALRLSKAHDSLRILLVEDEPVNRELMRSLLESLGHRPTCVQDGREACDICAGKAFDLILLDISMPRMNGFETARALRSSPGPSQSAPIVAMTAHATAKIQADCLAAGMDDYVAKPVSISKLSQSLSKWRERQAIRPA